MGTTFKLCTRMGLGGSLIRFTGLLTEVPLFFQDRPWGTGAVAVCAVSFLGGCGRSAPLLPQAVPATSEVIRIETTLLNDLPLVSATPDLFLGGGDDSTTAFGSISAIKADSAGLIYVLDGRSSALRVFSADGGYVRTIGKRGRGPGEFTGGMSLVLRGDTVILEAMGVHAFRRTGEYLWSLADRSINGVPIVGQADEYLVFWKLEGRAQSEKANDLTKAVYTWVPQPRSEEKPALIMRYVERHHYYDAEFSWPVVLSNRVIVSSSKREGVYYTVGDSFHIAVMSPKGETKRVYIGAFKRIPTDDSDLEDFRATLIDGLKRRRNPPTPPRFRGNGPVARHRPVIGALVVSDDGRFLVKRTDLSERPYDEFSQGLFSEWQLFAANGRPLYRMRILSLTTALTLIECAVYASAEDTAGNPVVERFRIPSKSCGL